jgi:hypothetical protein
MFNSSPFVKVSTEKQNRSLLGLFPSCQRPAGKGSQDTDGLRKVSLSELCAERNNSRTRAMGYGLRSAPIIATEITHFSEDRLRQAWRVPF